jgi:RES domain-containing protein
MPSTHLVDAIDRLDPIPYAGDVYRHVAAGRHPLSGAGARSLGGRWNPPQSFATLYLADQKATVEAEFRRMARRQGLSPSSFLPRRLYRIAVDLRAVIDLTDPRSLPEGIAGLELGADNLSSTQAIGEAAQYLGREGILAPSAAGDGNVLALFINRLMPDSRVDDVDFELWANLSWFAPLLDAEG